MSTKKVAITMPTDLVTMIDEISKQKKISRSRFISIVLREKAVSEREKQIMDTYNRVFSDKEISNEQRETALRFDGAGRKEGQEW